MNETAKQHEHLAREFEANLQEATLDDSLDNYNGAHRYVEQTRRAAAHERVDLVREIIAGVPTDILPNLVREKYKLPFNRNGGAEVESTASTHLVSWNELRASDVEQPEDVIKGFIPGSSLVMFSGDGGIGKSYVTLEMALQVAQGLPWLLMDTKQTPVLYIDLENRLWRQALRVEYVSNGQGLKEDVDYPVMFDFQSDISLKDNDGAEELKRLIDESGAGFVILDSLVDFLDGLDENSNPEMAEVCKRLRQIIDATGVTILAIHHVSKASAGKKYQSSRGASALKDNSDCSIQVVRAGGGTGNVLTMRHDKARDFSYKEVKAYLNWDNRLRLFNTTFFGSGDVKDGVSGDTDEQALLDCLVRDKYRKRSEVIDEAMGVTGKSHSTMSEKVSALIERGKVDEDPNLFGRSTGLRIAK